MNYFLAVAIIFAVYRISHLISNEDGPFDVFVNFRNWLSRKHFTFLYKLIDCFLCLSMWVSIPFTFLLTTDWQLWFIYWLALSGASIVVFKVSDR